jgi:hypothetical protein
MTLPPMATLKTVRLSSSARSPGLYTDENALSFVTFICCQHELYI